MVVEVRCQAATAAKPLTWSRSSRYATYDVDAIRALVSPSPRSNAMVTTRSGSTTCAGGLRNARSIKPNIPAFIPIDRDSIRTAPTAGAGEERSERNAERTALLMPIFRAVWLEVPSLSGSWILGSQIPDPSSEIPDPTSLIGNPGSEIHDRGSAIFDRRSRIADF